MAPYDFTQEFSAEQKANLERLKSRGRRLEEGVERGQGLSLIIQECLEVVVDPNEPVLWRLHAGYVACMGAIKIEEPELAAYFRDVLAAGIISVDDDEDGLSDKASILDLARRDSLVKIVDKAISTSASTSTRVGDRIYAVTKEVATHETEAEPESQEIHQFC